MILNDFKLERFFAQYEFTAKHLLCSSDVEAVSGGYLILLETDKLAKNIFIGTEAEGFFDNNYFDLLPGTRKALVR